MNFTLAIEQAVPVVCQLLGSKNLSDVSEAINFFVTGFEFGVSNAIIGVRRMLVLVWSKEAVIKEAVVSAYRRLYLNPDESRSNSRLVWNGSMSSVKLVIPLHSLYWSIHTKDESKRGTAFAFIFGVN